MLNFSTRAIHGGYVRSEYHEAINPPVFLNSTYAFETAAEGGARFTGESDRFLYHRVGNPTVAVFEKRISDLEGGEAAVATSSGMAAIAALLWSHLRDGDEIIADITLYGCTHELLTQHFPRFGIRTTLVDLTDVDGFREVLSRRTRIVLCETPANPTMRIVDIPALAGLCRTNGTMLVIDNTYATPYIQRPLELGAHAVVHSATKYLSGHGDLVAGVVVSDKAVAEQVRFRGVKELTGGCISSMDAFLLLRGLKTLALRMDRHVASAQVLAERLLHHPRVERVFYPGLTSCPQRELVARQMRKPGGMIALELSGGAPAAAKLIDELNLITPAVSLGNAETLIQHPASMTHSNYDPENMRRSGITEGLIRLSVGLEDCEDLWEDLANALARIG